MSPVTLIERAPELPASRAAQFSPWADFSSPTTLPENGSSAKWDKAIGKIYMMMSLGDDWDGMGAQAPPRELVASAIDLAAALRYRGFPPPARVIATADGTVALEWQEPCVCLMMHVLTPYRSEWVQIAQGGPPLHGVISKSPFIDPLMESMPPAYWVSPGLPMTSRLSDFAAPARGAAAPVEATDRSIRERRDALHLHPEEKPREYPIADFIRQTEYAWDEDFFSAEEAVRRYLKDSHADR
jgi:hypothetical protein